MQNMLKQNADHDVPWHTVVVELQGAFVVADQLLLLTQRLLALLIKRCLQLLHMQLLQLQSAAHASDGAGVAVSASDNACNFL